MSFPFFKPLTRFQRLLCFVSQGQAGMSGTEKSSLLVGCAVRFAL